MKVHFLWWKYREVARRIGLRFLVLLSDWMLLCLAAGWWRIANVWVYWYWYSHTLFYTQRLIKQARQKFGQSESVYWWTEVMTTTITFIVCSNNCWRRWWRASCCLQHSASPLHRWRRPSPPLQEQSRPGGLPRAPCRQFCRPCSPRQTPGPRCG